MYLLIKTRTSSLFSDTKIELVSTGFIFSEVPRDQDQSSSNPVKPELPVQFFSGPVWSSSGSFSGS